MAKRRNFPIQRKSRNVILRKSPKSSDLIFKYLGKLCADDHIKASRLVTMSRGNNRSASGMSSDYSDHEGVQKVYSRAADLDSADRKGLKKAKKYIRDAIDFGVESGYLIRSDSAKGNVLRVSSSLLDVSGSSKIRKRNRSATSTSSGDGEMTDKARRGKKKKSKSRSRSKSRRRGKKGRRHTNRYGEVVDSDLPEDPEAAKQNKNKKDEEKDSKKKSEDEDPTSEERKKFDRQQDWSNDESISDDEDQKND